jgi:hypothetical protein
MVLSNCSWMKNYDDVGIGIFCDQAEIADIVKGFLVESMAVNVENITVKTEIESFYRNYRNFRIALINKASFSGIW